MFRSILTFIAILLVLTGVNVFAYDFPLDANQCDQVIKNTYYNQSSRSPATTYNAQVCLSKAGYFSNAGGFTTNYGAITKAAAEDYLNEQKKPAQANNPAPNTNAAPTTTPTIEQSSTATQSVSPLSGANPSQTLTPEPTNTQEGQAAYSDSVIQPQTKNKNTEIADNQRQPQVLDKLLVNSVYFIFALPFILFGISIILAFARIFKKEK